MNEPTKISPAELAVHRYAARVTELEREVAHWVEQYVWLVEAHGRIDKGHREIIYKLDVTLAVQRKENAALRAKLSRPKGKGGKPLKKTGGAR